MRNQIIAKWCWRLLRWGLIALAALATLAAVVITEENWRSQRDWTAYQRAAEARGERLDWSFLAPSTVPDEDNFVKAPIFSGLSNLVWNESAPDINSPPVMDRLRMSCYRADGSSPEGVGGSWQQERFTPLKSWQAYYRQSTNAVNEFPATPQAQSPAADVLLALSKYDSALEELRLASRRPFSRFGEYADEAQGVRSRMTYLARLKGCAQVLQLRAIAELSDRQNAQALADVELLLRLDDQLRQEPLLIDHLVGVAISAITLQPVYEGLARHCWDAAQLGELEQALAKKDFLADFQFAMHGEKVFAVTTEETWRATREYRTMETLHGQPVITVVSMRMTPAAIFYQSELAMAQLNDELLKPLVDPTNRLVSPAVLRQTQAVLENRKKHIYLHPYQATALMGASPLLTSVKKFAAIQADFDLARVACALERYRLTDAQGEFPTTLEALTPQFIAQLPHDLINGQPLHYRRTGDGRFVLYSVGWNESDDGGTVAVSKNGTVNQEKGDWVWQYPSR
jgi:hypothetical protein